MDSVISSRTASGYEEYGSEKDVKTMKAMVYSKYGPPESLELQNIDKPAAGGSDVLVKVLASSVNWLDWHFLTGKPLMARLMAGVFKPKYPVLGIDVAGLVEEVGSGVTEFQPGDAVFGAAKHGCFAEYVVLHEEALVKKPDGLTFEEAAAMPGTGVPALHAIHDHGHIKPGHSVLINGASGGVGSFAVQIARAYGAVVTGVCSESNLGLVLSAGADQVIDYNREDFARDGQKYDLIFDVVANRSYSECREALLPHGIYLTSAFSPLLVVRSAFSKIGGGATLVPLPPKPPSKSDLDSLVDLYEAGNLKPIIDRCYPLHELPAALRYLEKGHARGKVVITI